MIADFEIPSFRVESSLLKYLIKTLIFRCEIGKIKRISGMKVGSPDIIEMHSSPISLRNGSGRLYGYQNLIFGVSLSISR